MAIFNREDARTVLPQLEAKLSETVDKFYPVGSIYMSANSTNPELLFGGKWTQLENKFLLGAGSDYTAGDEGGSPYIQAHIHNFTQPSVTKGSHSHTYTKVTTNTFSESGDATSHTGIASTSSVNTGGTGEHTHTVTGGAVGTVKDLETGNAGNMPPYLVVYMWQRTA